ncbi:EAL domain-containing protein [Clostridium sp. DL1XJH146]
MTGLIIVYTICSVIYLFTGIYIFMKDNKTINRLFFIMCGLLFIWSLLNILQICNVNINLWSYKIVAFISIYLYFHIVVFIIVLTKNEFFLHKTINSIIISIPFIIAVYLYCVLPFSKHEFSKAVYGAYFAMGTGRGLIYNSYYMIYYTYSMILSVVLLMVWGSTTKKKREKVQASLIIVAVIIIGIFAIIADKYLIEKVNELVIDPFVVIITLIPVGVIAYSINKYRLMNLNPKKIAFEAINFMNEGLIVLDENNLIKEINNGGENLLGFNLKEIKDKNISLLLSPNSCDFNEVIVSSHETDIVKKDGIYIPILLSYIVLLDKFGDKLSTVIIFQELSKIKNMKEKLIRMNNELENRVKERTEKLSALNIDLNKEINRRIKIESNIKYLAEHDELTGLANRRLLYKRIQKAIDNAKEDEYVILVFLDIDSFKNINDNFGHAKGDEVLKEISKRLLNTISSANTVARIGGDEFLILFNTTRNRQYFEEAVEKIFSCFKEPFILDKERLYVSTSIGIDIYPDDGRDIETLIKNADIALYSAKDNGKNTYRCFDELMRNDVIEQIKLSNDLYHALELNEIEVYYQPQVNQSTENIIGVEALARWNHRKYGMISPVKFIPIAEKNGLINKIGEYVLKTACMQNKKWQDFGFNNIKIAVNISVVQLNDSSFLDRVSQIIDETGVNSRHLELEVTEGILIKNINDIIPVLSNLKKLGIKISMDDFGTEYSSLKYLRDLPVDKIKIAREFVTQITVNKRDEEILSSIVKLIKKLDFEIIAEGVETKGQLDFLRKLGCEEIQGYYYYKPMPLNKIESILKSNVSSVKKE